MSATPRIACVLVGGPDRIIVVDGTEYPFEDHPRLGPCPLTKRGKERHLGPRHRFWLAVSEWYQGGKALASDGRCVWREPEDPTTGMVQVGKGMFMPQEMFERLLKARERTP